MKLPRIVRAKPDGASVTAPALPIRRPYHSETPRAHTLWRQWLVLSALAVCMIAYGFMFSWLPPSFLLLLLTPIALVALVVIWALPDTERPPIRSMEWAFACYFISLILWPYYLAIQIPGLPLLELRRLFAGAMLFFLLVSLSTSRTFRQEMKEIVVANRTFVTLLVSFVAVQVLSLILARERMHGLMTVVKNQLGWTAVFFVSVYLFSQPGRMKRWALTLVGLALTLSVIGFFEYRNQGVLWAEHIPSFLRVNDPAMVNLLTAVFREGRYRVVTTFSVSLSLAEFLALVMPFLIHGVLTAKTPLVRLACIAADIAIFSTILLTQARVGIVGAIVAHSFYGLVWAVRRWRTQKGSLIGPAATLAYPALFVLLGVAVLSVGRLRVMTLGGGTHAASTTGRLEQAAATGPVLLRSPLFGHGPRQGAGALGYTNPAGEVSIDSYLLAMLLDYGIVGFLLYYAMFIFMVIQALRVGSRYANPELAYVMPAGVALVVWLASKVVLAQEDSTSFTYMLLGLVAASVYLARRIQAKQDAVAVAPQVVSRSR
ncbi:O-antigen ligase family protein [Phenylobacterium sp. RIFCSPHIGHO2_01_FULL_69_31]|uniref:O-antigen ligase family protein n=1 Tax=Phenylobacterium sp. RIFCSPHIGHO2_01_FULL_69_31 TaxID=1801944 RepID=UPI0025FC901E|nr:O-antigen ligase family protein [Phenylobacterium sp. RIFCSPHIGHO2_01_FULL_69_31]